MNGDPRTGPLALGRWQRPAALVVAGLVPLDPYPMEKLLYCATCGQQFFGTHQPSGDARVPDGTQPTVCGTEECTEQRTPTRGAHPTDYAYQLSRPYEPCDGRVYRTLCDCRPQPLHASEVEIRIYTETHIHAFGPITHTTTNTLPRLTSAHYALLAVRFFTRIEVGLTVNNMTFINRI
jgi:hypothetical protein